jgi:hypothetical protein
VKLAANPMRSPRIDLLSLCQPDQSPPSLCDRTSVEELRGETLSRCERPDLHPSESLTECEGHRREALGIVSPPGDGRITVLSGVGSDHLIMQRLAWWPIRTRGREHQEADRSRSRISGHRRCWAAYTERGRASGGGRRGDGASGQWRFRSPHDVYSYSGKTERILTPGPAEPTGR